MIKTKMIQDGFLSCDDRLDDKINEFIKRNNITVVDIKLTSVNNRATALIIYEVEEDEKNSN
ncbi:MAG: hypothetical protein IKF82_01010 [Bacilli bacterium]|nr:hypothetical protein [Bacilli bacterium]